MIPLVLLGLLEKGKCFLGFSPIRLWLQFYTHKKMMTLFMNKPEKGRVFLTSTIFKLLITTLRFQIMYITKSVDHFPFLEMKLLLHGLKKMSILSKKIEKTNLRLVLFLIFFVKTDLLFFDPYSQKEDEHLEQLLYHRFLSYCFRKKVLKFFCSFKKNHMWSCPT